MAYAQGQGRGVALVLQLARLHAPDMSKAISTAPCPHLHSGMCLQEDRGFKQALCSSKGEHGQLDCASSSTLWPRAAPCKCITFFSFLQDLGITKVGHMKRILQAIKELSNLP